MSSISTSAISTLVERRQHGDPLAHNNAGIITRAVCVRKIVLLIAHSRFAGAVLLLASLTPPLRRVALRCAPMRCVVSYMTGAGT